MEIVNFKSFQHVLTNRSFIRSKKYILNMRSACNVMILLAAYLKNVVT